VSADVQQLFARLQSGDDSALVELTPTLYNELHRIASRQLRAERPNHTLQPTALIHEAYLKLFDNDGERQFTNQIHFLAVASRVMRQVLVDYARARTTIKRTNPAHADGSPRSTSLELRSGEEGLELEELLSLDDALQALAEENAGLAKVIEMRYFGGTWSGTINAWLKRGFAGGFPRDRRSDPVYKTPEAASASISAGLYPSSARISCVCWPGSGASVGSRLVMPSICIGLSTVR
jgi:RNA polymerase sigma-70 factor, ECF subfamily